MVDENLPEQMNKYLCKSCEGLFPASYFYASRYR